MIGADDVKGVADFLKIQLTEDQIKEVLSLYQGEQNQDPSAQWYLVVEKIIYDIT